MKVCLKTPFGPYKNAHISKIILKDNTRVLALVVFYKNRYKASEKNKINRIDDHEQWPSSIKSAIQWFPFHTIMEHTGNIMKDNTDLISSLLKMFSVSEIRLSYGEKYLDTLSLKFINCERKTGLDPETNFT